MILWLHILYNGFRLYFYLAAKYLRIKMINKDLINARIQLKKNVISFERDAGFYENERKQIFTLMQRTLDAGESNSALLIGPKGSGKTTLINGILDELKSQKTFESNGVLVLLNGLIHTDDRLALVSITTQMNLDTVTDGKVFGSFAENLAFLLGCLRTGNRNTSKCIIFIIENFELFCNHHNQTLLYNLFDISQSAQTPICIIGITSQIDVVDLLEKRVKSRFSHRQYFLCPRGDENSVKYELDCKIERIKELLTLKKEKELSNSFIKNWNMNIKNIVENKSFKCLIQKLLDIDYTEGTLKNILMYIVSSLNDEKDCIMIKDFEYHFELLMNDELVNQILDLSVLELCLLISMKHHAKIYDNQPMNFEMIYTRYVKFANSSSHMQTVQRPVVMKAFEHLQSIELVKNVSGTTGRSQKEYTMLFLAVAPFQIMEAVKRWPGLPTDVSQWAQSSIL